MRLRIFASLTLTFIVAIGARARGDQPVEDFDARLRHLIEQNQLAALEQFIQQNPPKDAVERGLYAVAAQRIALAATELTPNERRGAIEALLSARRDLLNAAAPNDPRRPIWMADLAMELLFDVLPTDGAHLTALFGISPAEQRERIAAAAHEILSLAQDAEQSLNRIVLDLESQPTFANDFQLQQRRRELIERERERRIPFLRGIGLILNAELNETGAARRQSHYQQAGRELQPIVERIAGAAAISAELYIGLAQARLGQFDDAETRFANAAKHPGAEPADIFFARMGGVVNRTVRGGPRAGLDALSPIKPRYADPQRENIFYRVVIADHEFLLHAQLARDAGVDQRLGHAAQAFAAYDELINANFGPNVSKQALRSIAFARMAEAIALLPGDVALDQLPAMARIAHADRLAREPHTRRDAIIALESELHSARLTIADRAAALFILAKALLDEGHHLFAAQRFIELARDYPGETQAESAIELGLALAADLHRRNAADAEARAILLDGLSTLFEKYPNLQTIDRWRYAAGRLAMQEGRFDEAQKLFAQIAPDAFEWLDAHFMQAAAARGFAQFATQSSHASARSAHEQTISAIERVTPIIEKGLAQSADAPSQRQSALRYYLASLHIIRAETLIDLNRPQEALAALGDLEREASHEPAITAQILKTRIACHQAMRQPQAALRDIKLFFETSPDQAPQVMRPMLASLTSDVQHLLDNARDDEGLQLAESALLPIAELLAEWIDARTDESLARQFALPLAQAFRLGDRCQDALVWHKRMDPQETNTPPALINRAECLFALGGDAALGEAMTIYKRIIAAGLDTVGRNPYWLAQLRTLQILDRAHRNTNQILPQIERLKLQDPSFGGERCRRGFEALRMKYAR